MPPRPAAMLGNQPVCLYATPAPPPPLPHTLTVNTRTQHAFVVSSPPCTAAHKPMAKKKEVLNEPGFAVCNDTPLKFKSNAQVFNSRKNAECVLEQVTALSDPCPPTPPPPGPPIQQESNVVSDVLPWLVSCPTTCAAKCLCVRPPLMLNYLRALPSRGAPSLKAPLQPHSGGGTAEVINVRQAPELCLTDAFTSSTPEPCCSLRRTLRQECCAGNGQRSLGWRCLEITQ